MSRSKPLDRALMLAGRQVAKDLGTWVLHVARTHPRLADVVGWARTEAAMRRGTGPKAKAWARLASWLEQLDAEHYPAQVAAVLDGLREPWRGPLSPLPPVKREGIIALRNARPLPN